MDPYLSIVIPIYNEEENIPVLWKRLAKVMAESFADPARPWEIIFTDDGSRDRSLSMLIDLAKAEPRIKVVEFNRNYGQHSAIFGAFAEVQGQVVVTLDADLQNPPEEIPKLVAKVEEGFDVVGISTVSGLLLWTHYWSMWLLGAIGVLALVRLARAQRRGDRVLVVGTAKIVAALAVGGLTFVPWLPTLLYQSQHTGTPWAPSFRVTTLVVTSITEFAGGPYSEAQLGVLLLTILVAIGVFGTGIDNQRIELDFFAHPLARRPLSVLALTIAIAAAVGMVNGMAFSPRYAAVFFPFFLILVALGLQQFKGGLVRDVVLVTFTALSLAGMFLVVRVDRTQARASVEVIERTASDGVVIACPDQLGPSVSRYLDRERYDITTYPRFASPELVDWVDYKARNERNDPVAFAQELLRRAEGRPLFLVYRDDFLTLKGQCQRVIETLSAVRPPRTIQRESGDDFYEPMTVVEFGQAGPAPG